MDYALMAENGSLLNTPPTYGIYVAGLVPVTERQGGLEGIAAVNAEKARILYSTSISPGGYRQPGRSRLPLADEMCWCTLADPALDVVLTESKAAGLVALKGHKSVGGMRAFHLQCRVAGRRAGAGDH